MASTYSDLKIELIGTGEQVGSWGATTNTNLGTALEEAITGSADIVFSSANVTLTLTNTNATQTARHLRLVCTGTSGGARQLILGSGCQIDKLYLVQNDLADAVTIKNTTGTGVTVAAGKKQFVFNNGTNVVAATDSTVNLASDVTGTLPVANGGTGTTSTTFVNLASNVTGTLPVANGGTGAATLTAENVILGDGTSAVKFVAPGTSGNILTSNGTTWVSSAASPAGGVTSFSAGTTGFTPNTGTSGTVTLAGTLGVGNGGTGQTGTPTNGQLLIGNGTNFTRATITAGSGITVSNGSGSISISATATGVTSVNGQTGAVTTTDYGGIGSIYIGADNNTTNNNTIRIGTTIAGSTILRPTTYNPGPPTQYVAGQINTRIDNSTFFSPYTVNAGLSGTWRTLGIFNNATGFNGVSPSQYGIIQIYVRIS